MLASSQSESERQKIRKKMSDDPTLAKILHQLETGEGENAEEREARANRTRKENEESERSTGQIQGNRNIIDLEDIAFSSHTLPNKQCSLPHGSFRRPKKG